jgi:serine/threonine-protein kinase
VLGRPEAEARDVLEAAGFQVASSRHTDEDVPAGRVAAQDPPEGARADPGALVSLQMSDGPKPVLVPNVVGRDYGDASGMLRGRRLEVKRSDAYSDSVDAGTVISQDPVPGEEVLRGSTVRVVVSRGPDVVEVPDVGGQAVEDAVRILEGAGFQVTDVVGYRPGKPVKRQDPPPGERVRRGTAVTLFM